MKYAVTLILGYTKYKEKEWLYFTKKSLSRAVTIQTCKFYLGEHGCSCFSLLPRGIIQHLWLKGVELCQLICCKMPLDLLLVHHTEGQRLFSHLSIVNLLLHCALKDRTRNTRRYFNNVSNNRLRKKTPLRWCLLINPTAHFNLTWARNLYTKTVLCCPNR